MKPAPHCLPSIVLRAARRLGVATLLALSMVPPAWAIIYVPPVVTSIARLQPGPVTTANTLTWRVTFNAYVTGVDSSDFTLTPVDGSATGTLSSVAAGSSAAEYIVTATGVSGTGTLRLDVNASGTDIIGGLDDLPLAGGFTLGQPYTHTGASVPVAWGDNWYGQLGNNLTDGSPVPVDVLVTGALAGKTVVAVAAGYQHSLALCSDGTVAAWGSNMSGQLGNNSTDGSLVPVAVNTDSGTSALAGKTVVAVSAGNRHSLALCSDGTVVAWGFNGNGQLGNNSTTDSTVPVTVLGIGALAGKTVVAVAAGGSYSLALCSDGTVTAWGRNDYGQLGNAMMTSSPVPVTVSTASGTSALSGKKVVAVSAGDMHSLALCSDGTVAAWGFNASGPLGNATTTTSLVPVAVSTASALSGKSVVAVSAGGSHSLALCNDGTVAAWGNNGSGRLGNDSTTNSPVPVAVNTASGTSALAGKTVVAVSAGLNHSLALCSDGTAVAWGYNSYGQLGNGSTTQGLVPVAVNATGSSALSGKIVSSLGTGGLAYHTLALASLPPPPPTTVTAVSGSAAGGYKAGDALNFTLTTSAAATVATTSGTPRLALTIGTATRYATYLSGSGTTSLVFRYTVQSGDTDTDGIAIASTSIDLNGGTINNASGVAIDATLPSFTLPTIVVDTTAPETTLDTTPANPSASASATFTFSSADTSVSFAASLDGAAYAAATSPATFTGLADGSHTFSVRAIDAAGNVDATPASFTWTVDTTAPETTLDTTPANPSASASATFTFSSTDTSASFAASLDGAAYAAATSPATFTGLADGSHTFSVRAIDAAGNVDATPVSFTWSVDSTAPTAPTIVSVSSASIAGTAEAGSTVRVYAGATLLGTTTADGSGDWSVAVTLADGAYSLTATATDSANNTTSTSGATTRTIDTTAPTVPTGLSGQATSPTVVALVWTASSDAGGVTGYRILRNGTAIATSAATAYSDTGLTAATAYTYTVTAYDAAGHESAQSAPATVATQSTGAQALAVGNTAELEAALTTAAANPAATYTITLAAGTYTPTAGLTISTSGLILEGRGTLSGVGLTSGALLTISGGNIALSGLTFADGAVVIAAGADDGTLDDCTFTGASLTGTACSGWTITGSSFSDTPAALTFSHADDLTFTENVILDCARALVLADVSSPIVRNNFIADNTTTGTTPAISLTDVTAAQIDNNSVYQAGTAASAIEYAGSGALGAIRNNLANRPITATGTATATLATNYTAAAAGWFRDVTAGDLHLAAFRSAVVDAGTTIAGLTVDIDGDTRPTGSGCDLGADEYQADTTAPVAPTGLAATVLSASQITLSWTASTDTAPSGVPASGVAGYRIFRNGTAIGTSTTASYADTGLSAGTTYTYTVTAYDGAANESAASGAARATTTAAGATGGDSGGGGAIGLLLPAVLALLALGRRRFVRR